MFVITGNKRHTMYNTPPAQLAVVSAPPAPTSNLPNYSTNINQRNEENVDPNDQGMYLLLKSFLFSIDHRGARKMNLFYYRGFVNHNIKVPPI